MASAVSGESPSANVDTSAAVSPRSSVDERIQSLRIHIEVPVKTQADEIGCFFHLQPTTQGCEISASPKLARNLSLARQTVEHVERHITHSSNFVFRSRKHWTLSQIDRLVLKVNRMRFSIQETTDKNYNIWVRGEAAEKEGVGNCGEMADSGMKYLWRRRKQDASIPEPEKFTIDRGNHEFIVIGRDPNTDPSDPSTWNSEAVICDPWTKTYFPASQMEEYLCCVLERDYNESPLTSVEEAVPVVVPYEKGQYDLRVVSAPVA